MLRFLLRRGRRDVSVGHFHRSYPQPEQRHYEMFAELSRQPWFQLALKRPYKVLTTCDCPYVAGSTTDFGELGDWDDWPAILIDRNAYPVIRRAGLLPGLIQHELVEAVLLCKGWSYLEDEKRQAHLIASAAENIEYAKSGIEQDAARKIYEKLIKTDATEKLSIIHMAMNLKPYIEPEDVDDELMEHIARVMRGVVEPGMGEDAGKVPKEAVDYGDSYGREENCGNCVHFQVIAKRKCLRVKGIIEADDWCRLHLSKEECEEGEAS